MAQADLASITCNFEIVTPMFLGGADQQAGRIREASVKGALAFWWRALNYACFVEAAEGNQAVALEAMQKAEQTLFGGPKGQGSFLLKVINGPGAGDVLPTGNILATDGSSFSNPTMNDKKTIGVGARYLGYGILNTFYIKAKENKPKKEAGELERSCIRAGTTFKLRIVPKPNCSTDEVVRALKLFGLLGGLGARVRRGWGSVALTHIESCGVEEVENWNGLNKPGEYFTALRDAIGSLPKASGSNFRLTAFAAETDIRVGTVTHGNPLQALNALGEGFLKYRARGKPTGKIGGREDKGTGEYVGGIDLDASFVRDRDWFRQINDFSSANGGRGNYIPSRTAFGLPHNYDSKHFGVTATGDHDRRASPLMFHIAKVGDEYRPVAVFMPTQFLAEEKAAVWQDRQENKTSKEYMFDPAIITDFLDGYRHEDGGKSAATPKPRVNPYFPSESIFSQGSGE